MKYEVEPKAREIFNNAITEALNRGDNQTTPTHLLLSILLDDNNRILDVLNNMNVNIDKLFDTTLLFLENNDLSRKNPYAKNKDMNINTDIVFIMSQVETECERLGQKKVNELHMMLALLKTKSQANQLLNKFNVNYKNFKDEIMDEFEDNMMGSGPRPQRVAPKKINKSKTPVLDKFCRDISKAVENDEIDPVVGRKQEIRRIGAILSRRKKNNPVLIGEPGTGKTAIIEGLATLIHKGEAPRPLLKKKLFSLDLSSIVAGTKYRGQFEERFKVILDELKANPDIIIFIDELHTIVGAGNASGALDAANILKPALARGDIQIIGATTLDEFRENIETDGALTRRFQQVLVEEPTIEETIEILSKIKYNYETYHNVTYSDDVIVEIVKLSDRYISGRAMPDNAIDILDEVGSSTNIDVSIPDKIVKLKARINEVRDEKMVIVSKQLYEEAAKLRDEGDKLKLELEKETDIWNKLVSRTATVITSDMVAMAISTMTGIPLTKLTTSENDNLRNLASDMKKIVIGQDEAIDKVSKAIKRSKLGIKNMNKPIGSFIFLGPTGVGKTFFSKVLAEKVFGDRDSMVIINMGEYMERHAMSKMIGAPPGYVGYGEGGKLTEPVRRKPYSVVLFDEVEKAHPDAFNLLLQLLDEGIITDSNGRKVDFRNTLIIMTSNLGVSELSQFGSGIGFSTGKNTFIEEQKRARSIIEKALKKNFKPEFLNRIDDSIIFNSLEPKHIAKIINNELDEVKLRIFDLGYTLKLTKSAVDFIAKEGYDKEFGARPLTRAIQRYVEDEIADAVMEGELTEGKTITIGYNKKNGITRKIKN